MAWDRVNIKPVGAPPRTGDSISVQGTIWYVLQRSGYVNQIRAWIERKYSSGKKVTIAPTRFFICKWWVTIIIPT
mgnify:CR=1 FL=1